MKKSSLSPLFISIAFGSYSQFEYNVSSGTPYGKLNPSAPELGKSSAKKLKSARSIAWSTFDGHCQLDILNS